MPRLTQEVTATTTVAVKLKPTVKKRLLVALRTYASLKSQRDALDTAMKRHRGDVEEIMDEVGEHAFAVEGFKAKLIAPVKKRLNKKKLVALGVSTDIIEQATDENPTTPYVKITPPGSREEDDDE